MKIESGALKADPSNADLLRSVLHTSGVAFRPESQGSPE
jgi:hypothetical protein